mgnify:CR=1 FL=1
MSLMASSEYPSERSARGYARVAPLVRRMLARVALVSARSARDAERFRRLGAPCVVDAGSMKFDGAQSDRLNPLTQRLASLVDIQPDDVVFLAGSTQSPEESLAVDAYRTLADAHPNLRLIVVPRHHERFDEVAALLEQSGLRWCRRSRLESNDASSRPDGESRWQALLVDTIGELRGWWGTAHYAYVGGSMGSRGGQNMIEPAAYGAAVSFGPNTWNFRDIVAALLARQAAVVVRSGDELAVGVERPFHARADLRGRRDVAGPLEALRIDDARELLVAERMHDGRFRRVMAVGVDDHVLIRLSLVD